jgi:polyisoprenoid-binding protein YceI
MVKRQWRAVRVCLLVWVFGLSAAGTVLAGETWRVDHNKSRIGFIASYDSIEFPAVFERWQGKFVFAPKRLAESKFDIVVDMGSVNTRSRDRDAGIRSEQWFDVKKFGNAQYVTQRFGQRADGTFEVDAEFRIKGISRPLKSIFTWTGDGNTRQLKGAVKVDRRTLQIGTGEWAQDPIIGFDVTITYDIVLQK